jgi:hypothetical protein
MNDQSFMRAMTELRERIRSIEHWLHFMMILVFLLMLDEIAEFLWMLAT